MACRDTVILNRVNLGLIAYEQIKNGIYFQIISNKQLELSHTLYTESKARLAKPAINLTHTDLNTCWQ
jgi:hypothetical protein